MPFDTEERNTLVQLARDIEALNAKMRILLPAFQRKCGHETVVQGERALIVNTSTRVCEICTLEEHGCFDEDGSSRGYKLLVDSALRKVRIVPHDSLEKYRKLQSVPFAGCEPEDRVGGVMAKTLKLA